MLQLITQWSIGFSIFCLLLLGLVYWFVYQGLEKTWLSKSACMLMLAAVAGAQLLHGLALQQDGHVFNNRFYLLLLYLSAPAFFLFVREVLQANTRLHLFLIPHFLPALIAPWLPGSIAVPMAFFVGGGYAVWLCHTTLRLRGQRQYFHLELGALVGFALAAGLILLAGLITPWFGERGYVIAYANFTAVVLFLILLSILRFPDIGQKTVEAVAASYAASTLKNTDCDALVEKLKQLLGSESVYKDENLSLASLAEQLGLTAHQTSELINTHFKMGFSRLVRQYRVEAAKQQLRDEPKASVLSIGLAVGFSSQSNFYTAFREQTGETPGQYRKRIGIEDT